MKHALLKTVLSVLFAGGVCAQSFGQIVISGVTSTNCITGGTYNGFSALTWTIGGSDPATIVGSGVVPGKPSLSDLVLTRNVDVCSEALIKSFLVGGDIPTLVLTQYEPRGAGAQPYAYMVVTLSQVVINGYSVGGSNSTDPAETVSFGYSKLCVQTTGQNPDGTLKVPVSVCYNLATNQIQ